MNSFTEYSPQQLGSEFLENILGRNQPVKEIQEAFKKDRYVLIRNFLPDPLPVFFYRYALMHADVGATILDEMVPDARYLYGDPLMESALDLLCPAMESFTGLKLNPTYAYCRIYRQGDVLQAHMDRPACEISATMTLGYDLNEIRRTKPDYIWPIFMEGASFMMNPGDMVIYRGCELKHWRDAFEGRNQAQLFMHYVDQNGKSASEKFDKRPALGLPACTRGTKSLEEAHKQIEKEYKMDLVMQRLRRKQTQLSS